VSNIHPILSDYISGTADTPPLLEVATQQNSKWEEKASSKNTRQAELVQYVSSTVSTGIPSNVNIRR
jgi:hypothetical protein